MSKAYNILFDENKIGTTKLEKADVPMGIVFGEIEFFNISSGYAFLKNYCLENKIDFTEHPEEKLISTLHIPNLYVVDSDRKRIKGMTCSISGMDDDIFEISIEGIDYSFYEEEFPHHVKFYNDMFKDHK
jgi:hypothetical protein